jgi:hypothetical protein
MRATLAAERSYSSGSCCYKIKSGFKCAVFRFHTSLTVIDGDSQDVGNKDSSILNAPEQARRDSKSREDSTGIGGYFVLCGEANPLAMLCVQLHAIHGKSWG